MSDSRDLGRVFGGIALTDDFVTIYNTESETDLRRSLASVAHVYGWDVSEEVVIPGWGRIDLVLEDDSTYLVELKIDLTKPARVRRAFQQADGYGRWWTTNKGQPADVFLVGADMDDAVIKGVADAYYNVWPRTISDILYFLEGGGFRGTDLSRKIRRARALKRAGRAAEISQIYTQALNRLSGHLPDPPEASLTPDPTGAASCPPAGSGTTPAGAA